jgi:murein DD-endopeptidase MepM/ murein hydrolase activator NlpD
MRLATLTCLIAALSAGLAACASTPREPARVDHRYHGSGSTSAAPTRTARPECRDSYTVQRGDTLSEIALHCGIEMEALANANSLYRPYALNVGQVLSMPRPPVHVVQRGENLYRIGLRYNVPFQQLAAHNGIRPPYELEVGQQIRLPQGATVVNLASRDTRDSAASTSRAPERPVSRPPAAAGAPAFDWPIRGSVLSSFGRKPDGGRNDGINIEARQGDSVRAAAAGQVVYAGSELAGYGQLILLRHTGGFVTAYAHNSRLLVREGDQVSQGQVIAEAGSTGSVDRPQVHFEIRNGVNPVDPMSYLR